MWLLNLLILFGISDVDIPDDWGDNSSDGAPADIMEV